MEWKAQQHLLPPKSLVTVSRQRSFFSGKIPKAPLKRTDLPSYSIGKRVAHHDALVHLSTSSRHPLVHFLLASSRFDIEYFSAHHCIIQLLPTAKVNATNVICYHPEALLAIIVQEETFHCEKRQNSFLIVYLKATSQPPNRKGSTAIIQHTQFFTSLPHFGLLDACNMENLNFRRVRTRKILVSLGTAFIGNQRFFSFLTSQDYIVYLFYRYELKISNAFQGERQGPHKTLKVTGS